MTQKELGAIGSECIFLNWAAGGGIFHYLVGEGDNYFILKE